MEAREFIRVEVHNKPELKPTTRENYLYLYEGYISPNLGERTVDSLRYSDHRSFYIKMVTSGVKMQDRKTGRLCQSRPFRISSMGMIHSILHSVLQLAVRDGYIQKNPAAGTDGRMHLRDRRISGIRFYEPQ